VAQAPPRPVIVDPPKVQPDQNASQPTEIAQIVPAPAPTEPPKPALQNVSPSPNPAQGRSGQTVSIPNASVQDAIRSLTRTAPQGGQSVGDLGADEGGNGVGLNLPPSAGRPRSNLELRSDPMGVDFRPYLLQVLAAVRRNWFAVYPEAARLGQRGQVSLEFAIVKQGTVTKVVFSGQSGAKALDQAAVAAISASNPLPPLPTEFKGDRIVLAMTFMYNMPRP
jgi:TonB family protein